VLITEATKRPAGRIWSIWVVVRSSITRSRVRRA
jgi:hypothetical protein